MNFELTEDQSLFQDAARKFAEDRMKPFAAEWDENKIFPEDVLREAAEMGFAGVYVRDDVGGSGMTRLDAALIFEQLARGCTSTAAYIAPRRCETATSMCSTGRKRSSLAVGAPTFMS